MTPEMLNDGGAEPSIPKKPPTLAAEAYKAGRWDLVFSLTPGDEYQRGAQAQLLRARALRDWGLSSRLIRQFCRAMGWDEDDFHGFDQLDRSFFPDAAPEQAIREMGRALLNGDDVDETVAAFFTRYARGERGQNIWADTARAEQQAMREAVDGLMAECQDITEQDIPRGPALVDAAEAYKAGRWDLVFSPTPGDKYQRDAQVKLLRARALRDWGLSSRLIRQWCRAMGWDEE